MRDAIDFMRGLFSFRENPFFLRAWRKESRNAKLVRNHAIILGCLTVLYITLHLLAGRFAGDMRRLGETPGVVVLGVLTGVHAVILLVAVSYRARDSIHLESLQGTLDFVRITTIPAVQAMGMRATYPLLFGLLAPLPGLPLYMLAACTGGARPLDIPIVYVVLALISVRPSGQSGAWYTRQLLPNDERKKHMQRRNAGTVVAIQLVAQGWPRLLPSGRLGPPLHGGLLPLTWALVGGRALFGGRPFYGIEVAIVCILIPLLPFLYATLARGTYMSATEEDAPIRWRRNPASAIWGVAAVVAVAGFTWHLITPSAALAGFAGAPGPDASVAIAALAGLLVVAWSVGCAVTMLSMGKTDAGLWACGGDLAPSRRAALLRELASSPAAVSVVVWPLLAVVLCAVLGRQLPALGVVGRLVLCSALALVVCYNAGRPGAIRSQLSNGKAKNPWRAMLLNLWMLVPILGLFPVCRVPVSLLLLHPFAGWLLAFPGAVAAVQSSTLMAPALPDLASWMTVQAVLALVLIVANCRYAVVTAGTKSFAEPRDLPPSPPAWRLFEAEPRRLRWVRHPITLRLLRSKPWRAMFISVTTLGSVLTLTGVAGAIYSPSTLARAFAQGHLIAPSTGGSELGDSLIAAFIIGLGFACLIGMGLSVAIGSTPILHERLRETIEGIVLLPASNREVVRGYLGAALYGIGTYLSGILPLVLLAIVAGCRPINVLAALLLCLAVTTDLVLGVTVGLYAAFSSPRGVSVPATIVWIGSRMALMVLLPMSLVHASRLFVATPTFWLVLLCEPPLIALGLVGAARRFERMRRGEAPLTVREEQSRKRKVE